MNTVTRAGSNAIKDKGWLIAHKWLLARRISQASIMALFLLGPWFGIWILKGNLNASMLLNTIPLTDPYLLLQSMLTGHIPETVAITGVVIVLAFYLLVGGRVFCSWVCPVNIITDFAFWCRERFNISNSARLSRNTRYWLLAATLLLAMFTGAISWEAVNPVSMLHRGLIFGMGFAWLIIFAVFILDLLVNRHGWCGHLCPMGAFYSALTIKSVVRVRADAREQCDDCMDCFKVCPEQHVIRPALKGGDDGIGPVITSANCTNCGRCIDVCNKNVFHFGLRFNNYPITINNSSGAEVLQ